MSLVFDEFCQRGWTKPAIALAQRMGGFEKQLRQLKQDRLSQAIETAANLEGKELDAITSCWRKYPMRPVLVYKLLGKGKLELAQELIFTWGLKVQPKPHHFRAAKERSKKFFKLLEMTRTGGGRWIASSHPIFSLVFNSHFMYGILTHFNSVEYYTQYDSIRMVQCIPTNDKGII